MRPITTEGWTATPPRCNCARCGDTGKELHFADGNTCAWFNGCSVMNLIVLKSVTLTPYLCLILFPEVFSPGYVYR